MGVAKDVYPRDGDTYSFVAGFAEVEVDVETGVVSLVDFLAVGDVGTVVNPRSLIGQINGGCCLGIAHALHQKLVYDPHYGRSLASRFHYNKPITILDVPNNMQAIALNLADPGVAGRRARRRRAAGGRRLWRGPQRDRGCDRRGRLPPRAGDVRHRLDVAHPRQTNARAAAVASQTRGLTAARRTRRDKSALVGVGRFVRSWESLAACPERASGGRAIGCESKGRSSWDSLRSWEMCFPYERKTESHERSDSHEGRSPEPGAPAMAPRQRGGSPLRAYALRPVLNDNCVTAR